MNMLPSSTRATNPVRVRRVIAASAIVAMATLTVACGEGALRLLSLQREGKRPLPAAEFLRGLPVPSGTQLL